MPCNSVNSFTNSVVRSAFESKAALCIDAGADSSFALARVF